MIMTMGSVAFAADETGSITIKPSDTVAVNDKNLKAYKILDATYSGTGDSQAVAYTIPQAMVSFFNSYAEFATGGKTATENAAAAGVTLDYYVTNIMKDWGDDSAKIKDFAVAALAAAKAAGITATDGTVSGNNIVFSDRTPGYYVIEDTATEEPISAVMLDTVTNANVEITLKASDESKKEIVTVGDLANSKANELGIGRDVEYKITQKIPDTTGYDYFYYMINDTLSTGLTFKPESVVVKVGDKTLAAGSDYYLYYKNASNSAEVTAALGSKTFIIAFENVVADVAGDTPKYNTGDTVTVTYLATVNSDAIVGVNPNTNDANVTYSNNPNKDQRGDSVPGIPANTTNHPVGEGPHKFTDTYSTKLTVYKEDATTATKTALEGVEFTLTGSAKDVVINAEEVYTVDPNGTYYLLKSGLYTETAPSTAPSVTATTAASGWVADSTYTGTDARVVGSQVYRPYKPATDSGKDHYIIVEPNAADYVSTTTKYSKTTVSADAAADYTISRSGLTGSDGTLVFSQLGAGSYTLSETGVLPGFNGIADITFDITCTLPDATSVIAGTEKATWAFANVQNGTIEFDETNGTFKITIENKSGTELPSTGGIGTTIFYILGSLLVLGAGIILVTKRRMSVEK